MTHIWGGELLHVCVVVWGDSTCPLQWLLLSDEYVAGFEGANIEF